MKLFIVFFVFSTIKQSIFGKLFLPGKTIFVAQNNSIVNKSLSPCFLFTKQNVLKTGQEILIWSIALKTKKIYARASLSQIYLAANQSLYVSGILVARIAQICGARSFFFWSSVIRLRIKN